MECRGGGELDELGGEWGLGSGEWEMAALRELPLLGGAK